MEYHSDGMQFAQVIDQLCITFEKTLKKEQVRVYFDALVDMKIDAIIHGCSECMKHELRFPAPAKIREYANGYRRPTPKIENNFQQVGNVEFGKACADLICRLHEGTITFKQYLIEVGNLAIKYNRPQENYLWIDDQWQEFGVR